jgi:nucleotide-binding universal stress UspA family protein
MSKIIVVPTDFSEISIVALKQAANFSKVFGSEIHLVHVLDTGLFHFAFMSQTTREEIDKERHARLFNIANEIENETGIKIKVKSLEGKIYAAVDEYANEIEASYIIMGTSGTETIKRKILGSNALKVVRDSKVPVITIKGSTHTDGCKKIVLPLDLTKETREKVTKATDIAQMFKSKIDVISVKEFDDSALESKMERQMHQVLNLIGSYGVEAEGKIIKKDGNIAETVIRYSNENDADLIIIMTQQEQNITDYFIGSSAQEIIATSEIPVLSIIPTPKNNIFDSILP